LQCVAVCCSVLQCVAVCCSVLWFSTYMVCPVAIHMMYPTANESLCCSVLQCVAVCCSVLQCVAVCCSVHMMYPTAKEICGISSCERALHIRGFYLYGTSICESISTAYCKEDVLYFQLWKSPFYMLQPIADRSAQHLEILSKHFRFSTRRTRILMGFIIYYLVLIVNPVGRILVCWKRF